MVRLPKSLQWRYDLHLAERFELYGSVRYYLEFTRNNIAQAERAQVAYVFANKGNIGDYISHRGLLDGIGKPGPWLLCSPLWKRKLRSALGNIKNSSPDCMLIIGGGGLLQPVFEEFWREVLNCGLRFSVVGVGINTIGERGKMDTRLMKAVAQAASILSVRDRHSKQQIQRLVGEKRIHLTICPSVHYLLSFRKLDSQREKTLLHMVHPADMRLSGVDVPKLHAALLAACQQLGLRYVESTNIGSDHVASIQQVATAEVVVSSRLHGCIMAYALCTPYISIACDRKIKNFNDTHTGKETFEPDRLYHSNAVVDIIESACVARDSASEVDKSVEHLCSLLSDIGHSLG